MGGMKLTSKPESAVAENVVPVSRALVMPEARALAGVIRRRRERLKLSLNALARRAGISRQMLGNIERDINIPTADTIARIATALGMSYGGLNMSVTGWLARQPACCRACKYACMARGELPWLNRSHGCGRPAR